MHTYWFKLKFFLDCRITQFSNSQWKLDGHTRKGRSRQCNNNNNNRPQICASHELPLETFLARVTHTLTCFIKIERTWLFLQHSHGERLALHLMFYLLVVYLCVKHNLFIFLSSMSRYTDLYAVQTGETATGSHTDLNSHEQRIQNCAVGR